MVDCCSGFKKTVFLKAQPGGFYWFFFIWTSILHCRLSTSNKYGKGRCL